LSEPSPGHSGRPSLGIVVPVYNEARSIETACRAIVEAARKYVGPAVVIAIDDGSADGSWRILSELASELEDLELQRHPANAGYGEALRTGASRAAELRLDYVVFIDSDLTNPPEDLLKIGALASSGSPYIKASRYLPGGGMSNVPWSRRLVSRVGNATASALFSTPVRDVTNGFRAVRTDLFRSWPLRESGFAMIVEEFDHALQAGIEPAEFPSILRARDVSQRGSAFSYTPRMVWSYLRYPLRASLRRVRRRARGGNA
jgi:dolichol-phosphate mannosyltransferase